jgi:glycosyltransferase involved in cell wall biosynthesis
MTQTNLKPACIAQAKHLLVLIHSLGGGGAERTLVELAGGWIRQGKRVTVVTLSSAHTDVYPLDPNVQRLSLDLAGQSSGLLLGLFANLRRVFALRHLLVRNKPDIVLGFMTTSSVLAVLASKGLPVACIASEHTHPPFQNLSKLWRVLRSVTYPRATAVVTLAQGTAQWVRAHIPKARVLVIPNPVAWPLVNDEPVIHPAARVADRKRLLAVGRLHPDKGFDLLIEAFKQIASDCQQWDLVVLGEGEARSALQQQIEQAGLSSRITLIGRVGNMADWYQSADLYVLSSRVEGLSNTLLEAMASGLPAVSFDCDTGPRDIIEHGVNGLLVTPNGSSAALAQVLLKTMTDASLRQRLSEQAHSVRQRFALLDILARWDRLFDEVS